MKPIRLRLQVGGEGGESVSLFVPESFEMKGLSESIKVKISATAGGDSVLSGVPGDAGSLSFNVGGEFELHEKLRGGTYAGSIVVSVSYD